MPNELRAPRRVIAKSRDRFLPILLVVILLSIVMTIVLRHLAEQYPEAVSSAPGGGTLATGAAGPGAVGCDADTGAAYHPGNGLRTRQWRPALLSAGKHRPQLARTDSCGRGRPGNRNHGGRRETTFSVATWPPDTLDFC